MKAGDPLYSRLVKESMGEGLEWGVETGGSLELTGQPVQPMSEAKVKQDSVSKIKRG